MQLHCFSIPSHCQHALNSFLDTFNVAQNTSQKRKSEMRRLMKGVRQGMRWLTHVSGLLCLDSLAFLAYGRSVLQMPLGFRTVAQHMRSGNAFHKKCHLIQCLSTNFVELSREQDSRAMHAEPTSGIVTLSGKLSLPHTESCLAQNGLLQFSNRESGWQVHVF